MKHNYLVGAALGATIVLLLCGDVSVEAGQVEAVTTGSGSEAEVRRHTVDEALAVARGLIDGGRPEAAYRLLRRVMDAAVAEDIDTTTIRFMAAQALLAGRHYAQAAQLLGRLAEDRPELDRVRLDYAAVLFTIGRDDEADAIFRDIRRKADLTPDTQHRVEGYLERIRDRQRWRLDFDMGFRRDDNVNNATEDETVAIPAFGGLQFTLDQRPVRAWVARTGARLRWREPITEGGRLYVETQASVARNSAIGASEYNRTWANLSTGPRLPYMTEIAGLRRPGLLSADLGIQRNWRGGDGYTRGLWVRLGVEQTVDRDWRLGGFPRYWITRYDEGTDTANPRGYSLDLYVARRIGSGWLTVGGKVSRESPEKEDLRWTSRAASVRYVASIGRNWSVSVGAGLTKTTFDAEAPLFFARRDDRTHDISMTASHRSLAWEGYLPELTLNLSRTASNIPLYDHEVRSLRLGLRRLF